MLVDPVTGDILECPNDECSNDEKKMRQLIDYKTGLLSWVTDDEEDYFSDDEAEDLLVKCDKAPKKSLDAIQVQSVSASYRGLRDYTKEHCCFFCEKMVLKMARHLLACHSDKIEVKAIPSLPPEGSSLDSTEVERIKVKRAEALDRLRNLGDFNHNVNAIAEGSGTLIVGKRNRHTSVSEYLPCSGCYVFYLKKELWRHCKKCKLVKDQNQKDDEDQASKHNMTTSRLLLYGAGGQMWNEELDFDYNKYVIHRLMKDEVSLAVINDKLLVDFGKAQFEKLGIQRASDVRAKLRILGRIKLQLREIVCFDYIEQYLSAQLFDTCVTAIKHLGIVSKEKKSLSGTDLLEKPDLVLKAGQLLKKVTIMKRGKALRSNDSVMKEAADGFLELYLGEWADKIGGIARCSISQRKYNRKIVLPMTEDVVKVSNELDKSLRAAITKVTEHAGQLERRSWLKLAKVLLARITIFNKRRGNEPSKMLLGAWKWVDEPKSHNQEIQMTLTKVEKYLLDRMYLIEILGKQNKKVPVLLTAEMRKALELLIKTRNIADIPSGNPYVFPQGKEGHMSGCQCIKEVAAKCGLQKPNLITTTLLRKYTATVAQVLNLSDSDVGELARHMGHELAVHRKFYRLQEDVIELAKISKLLLLIDSGKVNEFKNKNLDDIEINDLFDEEHKTEKETVEEDEEQMEMQTDDELKEQPDESLVTSSSETSHSRQQLRLRKQIKEVPQRELEEAAFSSDNSLGDPDFNPTDSADEADMETVRKTKVVRTVWSPEELEAISRHMLPKLKISCKPPRRDEIIELQKKCPVLKARDWKSVKFRAWALFQKQKKTCR